MKQQTLLQDIKEMNEDIEGLVPKMSDLEQHLVAQLFTSDSNYFRVPKSECWSKFGAPAPIDSKGRGDNNEDMEQW